MNSERKLILYADDDADDREFLSSAIRQLSPTTDVILAENGVEAMDYLVSNSKYPLPCLIVLDLNMPLLDGRETYEKIQLHPELKGVPTIVFTSSLNPNDRMLFEGCGVEFISKPDNLSYLNNVVHRMLERCYC